MSNIDRRTMMLGSAAVLAAMGSAVAAPDPLETMAVNQTTLWNGVARTPKGRIFVSLPNWLGPAAGAGEVGADGVLRPWPGNEWNRWQPGTDGSNALVSVNAIRLNLKGDELWVLDAGAPLNGQRLPGGAKLVVFDVASGATKKVIPLGDVLEEPKAAANDIRFHGNYAFMSESGVGSILVLDLRTDKVRRLLIRHPLLVMDPKREVKVDGAALKSPNGNPFGTNANQLEVSPDGRWFYIQPLNGGMARIEVSNLLDEKISPEKLAESLKPWVDTPPLSGTAIDRNGNLYLNCINDRTIRKLTPEGKMETIVTDTRLRWADAPWLTDDGWLWLPIAQLGWTPMLNNGQSRITWPTQIFRTRVFGA